MLEPFGKQLVAGTTWSWPSIALSDYPAALWALKFFFRGLLGKLDIAATADGDSFAVTVPSTGTPNSNLPPGLYAWSMRVESLADASNKVELDRGTVDIVADIANLATYDARSLNRKMLDAIQANLLGMAGRQEQEYQIQGRMLRLMSRKELLELEGVYQWRVNKEKIDAGQLEGDYNQVRAGFGGTR